MILSKMKEVAEGYLGKKVTHAVVTVVCFQFNPRFTNRLLTMSSPPTSTTTNARLPRTPVPLPASTSCVSSTSPPRPPLPTVWTRPTASARSLCTTLVVVLSMCLCSPSTRASSRFLPRLVTPTWVVRISTSASSTSMFLPVLLYLYQC